MLEMDRIMEIYSQEPGPWTVPELARRLDVKASTHLRMVVALLVAQGDLEPCGRRAKRSGRGRRPVEYRLKETQ